VSHESYVIVVRPVRRADAAQLRENCFSANTLDQVEQLIDDRLNASDEGMGILLVAEVDGLVVGTGTFTRNAHSLRAHRGEVGGLVVHPAYQRRGIARRIVEDIRERAASMGVEILEIGCRGGTPAEVVYPRLGFIECGRLPRGLLEPSAEGRAYDEVSFYMPLVGPGSFAKGVAS
jgi:GNAT superfamily N-acetyltransferase